MPDATPSMDNIIVRSAINGIINQLQNSERPMRILIHGPRKGGKTSALSIIKQKATPVRYRSVRGEDFLSGTLEDASDQLILFDDLDNYLDRITELSRYPKSSVIATAQGRYRPVKGAWDNWKLVPLGPFSRAELEELARRFGSIPTDQFPKIIDRVIYLSNGHPFFASIELESIRAPEEERNQILIDKICQYLINLTITEKKALSLIAVASGCIVAPHHQENSPSSPKNRSDNLLSRVYRFFNYFAQRSMGLLKTPSSADRQKSQAPLTTDALMVTYDAQEWLLGPDPMSDLLNALDYLDDEGIITYNPASGWQIIPTIITYYRHRGWSAIKELGLEDYFRRWRTGV